MNEVGIEMIKKLQLENEKLKAENELLKRSSQSANCLPILQPKPIRYSYSWPNIYEKKNTIPSPPLPRDKNEFI